MFIVRLFKSFIIAFSMYSKVPMPMLEWKEEDMKYVFCFFPFIGVLIGGIITAWNYVCFRFELPEICRVLISAAIPLLVTGGIHADGFMDVSDAFRSYKSKEEKLKILKDPHIGAFSVIMFALYGLIFVGALSLLKDTRTVAVFSISFVIARCLSAISSVSFKSAKEGTLSTFSKSSNVWAVRIVCILLMLIAFAGMVFLNPIYGCVELICAIGVFIYYYLKTKKELCGVTGDTAGYLVLICEEFMLVGLAIVSLFF